MNFIAAVRCFGDAITLVRRKELRRFVWLPLIVSLLVILPAMVYAIGTADRAVHWLMSYLPQWLSFLSVVATPVLYLLAMLISAWLCSFLAILIGSPLLSVLSGRTEEVVFKTHRIDQRKWWQALLPTLSRELRKLAYYLPRLLLVCLLTLIPVLNTVSPIIWFVFGAWISALQFLDYPVENRMQDFTVCADKLKQQRGFALGFGSCASLLLSIPLLNFLAIPVCAIAGTLAWNRLAAS